MRKLSRMALTGAELTPAALGMSPNLQGPAKVEVAAARNGGH